VSSAHSRGVTRGWCVVALVACLLVPQFFWGSFGPARADPPAPIPEPILPPLAPGQVLRIGPTAGTGTPTGDYGIGATDLCEFVEFPSQLLQVCGDSFAGQGVGFGGWYSPVALHVDTSSVDDPTGVRYTGVTGISKPLLADPTPSEDSQLPAGVVEINRRNYLMVTTTRNLVPQNSRLVTAEPAHASWQTVPESRRDAAYQGGSQTQISGYYDPIPAPDSPGGWVYIVANSFTRGHPVVLYRATGVLYLAFGAVGALGALTAWSLGQQGAPGWLTWLVCIAVAAAVTLGLVRPVRRLLAGTAAVEGGALDTVVPITSRDEIGRLTRSFNSMVGELRVKAQIRETFGKYVDPRIVAGLIDRPELTDAKGSRREMTILFCDMKGFTTFSEGMTPAALVTVLNRYMTVMSEPVRHHSGIIDKYIGDAIMAFWGPPFTGADEQARLACLAALDQLAGFAAFRAELPDLIGLKRGFPEIDIRIGIATGDVVVGSIGSEQTRNYTVIGDTVNLASRIEGANKTYGTRVLISEATNHLAADMLETREIDTVVVVGKTEPQRIFELVGRKGEVARERLALRDAYVEALDAYRRKDWEKALAGFEDCLAIVPCDAPSKLFLERIAQFRVTAPGAEWNGVWSLVEK